MSIIYYLDGVDLLTYGVHVSSSKGLISRPKIKNPVSHNWETIHGESVDLASKYYEARDLELECFIVASTKQDFITKCGQFFDQFDKAYTRRLMVQVDELAPLVYEVYIPGEIEIKKEWKEATMVGTFTLKLREPEPVKRVIRYTRTGEGDKTVSITVTSTKVLNVYWGDGNHAFDLSGNTQTVTHSYTANGTYYIVVTGCIDEITSFTTTGTVIWQKL